jgi:hypothetical protein
MDPANNRRPENEVGDGHPTPIPHQIQHPSYGDRRFGALLDPQAVVATTIGLDQFPPIRLRFKDIDHLQAT